MVPLKYLWALRALLYKPWFNQIGNYSYIGKPILIHRKKNIKIKDRVRIFPGARIETIGQGEVTICENTSIGQNLHLISYQSNLAIGANTTISGNVLITNVDHDYRDIDTHIMNQTLMAAETKIGDNCFIGYGSVILAGTILGKQCVVGANSVVKGVFPDYCVIAGSPARIVKKYNTQVRIWEKYSHG